MLVTGIQLRNDEVDRHSVTQHMVLVSIFKRTKPRKRGQQTVMKIDDAASGKLPAQFSREDSHESGEHDVIDFVLIHQCFQSSIVRIARSIANPVPANIMLFRDAATGITITDHHSGFRCQPSIPSRQRMLCAVRFVQMAIRELP